MNFLDPNHLINSYGTLGILFIIFAESGLFCGGFLPGDSLLVTAGFLAATHESSKVHLNLAVLLVGIPIAAILGDQVGYWFGRRVGPSLFRRPESRFFKPEYLKRADEYLEQRGAHMIILARFIPGVRTFTPIAAGASRMRYALYLPYDIAGCLIWGVGVTLAGYTLGSRVKHIDRYLIPVILVVVGVSLIPVALELRRATKSPKSEDATRG